ncbi:hypothetical protein SARC_10433 [Sphaeroforma arctica JP610]|uniref:Proline dehydrogenase n=1 Tax=Sphaeroforma arctica JP610 TaxID=667725 RepID=A0A0L0FM57_9EUKA|nr:hypothetical protein SARC_10433 [Sphaeroforma arctica JP610]KNC77098.1 hypothetical protein SARC_10433 [Sphaeroforma arctica JP610]|eukprot:XP_014151000.1 hypothetical protein SARC_10433 [Sphaeroforma arctica JP610]
MFRFVCTFPSIRSSGITPRNYHAGFPSKVASHGNHSIAGAPTRPVRAVITPSASHARGIAIPASTAAGHIEEPQQRSPRKLLVDFGDFTAAYKYQNLATLLRSYSVLKLCQYGVLVRNSRKLIDFSYTVLGDKLTNRLMEFTFYGHFCGGEDAVSVERSIQILKNANVGAILDYAAEADVEEDMVDQVTDLSGGVNQDEIIARTYSYENEAHCDINMDVTRHAVMSAGEGGPGGFAAVKLTSLGRPDFLESMAKKLVNSNLSLSGCLKTMCAEEVIQYENMIGRVEKLATTAQKMGVSLLIDAEQTYMQPTIDRVVLDLQRRYNKDTPVVYNTFQCYLTDSASRAKRDLEYAKKEGWIFAAKFVRGAYIVQERARAEQMGYEDPIHDTIYDTHKNYNDCVRMALKDISHCSIMVATHNEESVWRTVQQMKAMGIPQKGSGVYFGQLLGMCDHITYNLGREGFEAFKYVPYGPVHEVLPYLIRRAVENSDIMGSAQKELTQLKVEIRKRLTLGLM